MAVSRTSQLLPSSICQSCRHQLRLSNRRLFTTTPQIRAENGLGDISNFLSTPRQGFNNAGGGRRGPPRPNSSTNDTSIGDFMDGYTNSLLTEAWSENLDAAATPKEPHRIHIMANRYNTIFTFTQPPRPATQTASSSISFTTSSAAEQNKQVDTLLSISCGAIGYKNAKKGSYDAAHQLAAFSLKQMQERGMLRDVTRVEVVLRGFGAGREAVTKALLGDEGRFVRGKICSVIDASRMKLGGPRGKKIRRLG